MARHDRSAACGVAQSPSEKRVLLHSFLVEPAELESPSAQIAGAQVAPMMDANRVTARIKYSFYIHHALSNRCASSANPEIALSVEHGVRHHRNRPWFRPG